FAGCVCCSRWCVHHLLHAVHNGAHRLIEVLVTVPQQNGPTHIFSKIPQCDMRLGIDDHQSKLAENGEFQSCISERPTDLEDQVGVCGGRNEHISAPTRHRRVELVVRPIRTAIKHGLINDSLEAFSTRIGNENLLGSSDLCG